MNVLNISNQYLSIFYQFLRCVVTLPKFDQKAFLVGLVRETVQCDTVVL